MGKHPPFKGVSRVKIDCSGQPAPHALDADRLESLGGATLHPIGRVAVLFRYNAHSLIPSEVEGSRPDYRHAHEPIWTKVPEPDFKPGQGLNSIVSLSPRGLSTI